MSLKIHYVFQQCIFQIFIINYFIISCKSICPEGKQYFDNDKKECITCKKCISPYIVIASCQIFSNTKCGIPSFISTSENKPHLQLLTQEKKPSKLATSKLSQYELPPELPHRNKTKKVKVMKHKCKKKDAKCKSKFPLKKIRLKNSNMQNNRTFNDTLELKITEFQNESLSYINQSSDHMPKNTKNTFIYHLFVYEVTLKNGIIILAITIGIWILCCCLRIFQLFCEKLTDAIKKFNEKKNETTSQKLPDPSSKPIKYRFTAVLPNKTSVEYVNIHSALNGCLTEDPSVRSSTSSSSEMTILSHITGNTDERFQELAERCPLASTINSNIIETYQIEHGPTTNDEISVMYNNTLTNPFIMDELLENRRTAGCNLVENNLYTEVWHSSPVNSRYINEGCLRTNNTPGNGLNALKTYRAANEINT